MKFEDAVKMKFRCFKCKNTEAEVRKLATTGTGLTKIFDIQSNEFYAVICKNCGYTEFYERSIIDGKKSVIGDVVDVLFG